MSVTLVAFLSTPHEAVGGTLIFDGRPQGAVNSDDTRPYPNEDWYSPTKIESIEVVRPDDLGWGPVWGKVFRFHHSLSKDAGSQNPGRTATNWVWDANSNQGRTGLGTGDLGISNGVEQWLGRSVFFPENFPRMAIKGGFANFRASKIARKNGGGGSSSIHWWLHNDKWVLEVQGGPIDCNGDGYISRTATLFDQIPKGIWIDIKVHILFRTDNEGYFVVWVALRTDLTEPISSGATTIPLRSTAGLPESGSLVLGGAEEITYTGKTSSSVTGVTRGVQGAAIDHPSGTVVTQASWKKVWDSRSARHSTLKSYSSCGTNFTWLGSHAIGVYRSWVANVDQAPDITWGERGIFVSHGERGIDRVLGHTGVLAGPGPAPPTRIRGLDRPEIRSFTYVADEACPTCRVGMAGRELWATVASSTAELNRAYGLRPLGNLWSGRIWTRTVVALGSQSTLESPLVLLQMRDAADNLVYQVVASPVDGMIAIESPAGGLDAGGLRLETGVQLGETPRRVEVSAKANDSIAVRVDGRLTNELTGLAGATSTGQDVLRAGIVDYSGSATEGVTVVHRAVGASMAGWLGTRTRSLELLRRPKTLGRKRLVVRLRGIPMSRVNVAVRSGSGGRLGRTHARLGRQGLARVVVPLRRWNYQRQLRIRVRSTYLGPEIMIVNRDSKRISLRAREQRRLARG